MKSISIIIPAFNEQLIIKSTLTKLHKWAIMQKKYSVNLLIINDGSKDTTEKIIKDFINNNPDTNYVKLINTDHIGQQNATLTGIKAFKSDYYLIVEADYPVSIEFYESMLIESNKFDIVQGSRNLKESEVIGRNIVRKIISKCLSKIFRMMFVINVTDPQIGSKIFNHNVSEYILNDLTMKHDGMKMTEILVRAYCLGFKIKEMPIKYKENNDSKQVPINIFKITKLIKVVLLAFLALIKLYYVLKKEEKRGLLKHSPFKKNILFKLL